MTRLVKPLPELKKRQLSPKQKKLNSFSLGEEGENIACKLLTNTNYLIIDKNIRWKNLEIDIIALDKKMNEIVFIEVKTRKNEIFGHPSHAVNQKKLDSMIKTAQIWLKKQNLDNDYRFDIISVIKTNTTNQRPRIEHIKNVTLY